MKETMHIQSIEAREKIINQFCKLIAVSAIVSALIYIYLEIHILAVATSFIATLFLFFVYLNKKGYFKLSRAVIIVITNAGIIFFSFYLGFNSGIYLYLFVAPLLIYLLFDFNEKKSIICFLLMYITTFILIYFYQNVFSPRASILTPMLIKFLYSFNFCVTLILSFGLVTYFAGNNSKYILSLTNQQELLLKEVDLRNKGEELLKKSLTEREILLAEIHHRVKNNLAIVSALINMQIENLQEEKSKQIFEETRNRIYAMSLIHNLLYQNKSFASIDFEQYVAVFCNNISESYQLQSRISIEHKIEHAIIDINTAIPLALILNELITNSFKHAFTGQSTGKITIELKTKENRYYQFSISDSGVGMDEEKIRESTQGMNIVMSLIEQVGGELKYQNDNGCKFIITLPISEKDK